MKSRRILVTAALPYVNGPIHIGYLVEAIQADIWARFQRLRGHECIYVCADDAHGTATMIHAKARGLTPEALVAQLNAEHKADLEAFGMDYAVYGTTHTETNRLLAEEFWRVLRENDMVVERDVTQLFDPKAGLFLADRFVRGMCPKCATPDQPGDNCSSCGSTYTPADLVNPKSAYSNATPELRSAKHFFIAIERQRSFLESWIDEGGIQQEAVNYLRGQFLSGPLHDWDVSRPAPYFGFEIPDAPGHYWYVWFDAPMGYVSNTKDWCDTTGASFEDWWQSDDTEIRHFIGKDIAYFHCLFWPALLKTAGYTLPRRVQIHGMLTFNGEKMSKSRGELIEASVFRKHLDPVYLRYYFASKLSSRMDDFDFNTDEFVAKVNSDLVGKVVNLASRTARFVQEVGLSATYPDDGGLFATAAQAGNDIAADYERCEYQAAVRRIMALADAANTYVEAVAPWALRKDPEKARALQDACTVALNLFKQLMIYLAPITPTLTEKARTLLGVPLAAWHEAATPTVGKPIAPFEHLLARAKGEAVETMLREQRERVDA